MAEPYNRFSGQSLERVTALSDGVFAVAMTLLVLDVRALLAQALYAAAALICLLNTVASLIALIAVQLYFIASPQLSRITKMFRSAGEAP